MTPEFKAKWIADLRRYAKTVGMLKDRNGYCCLGVACLTLGGEFIVDPDYDGRPLGRPSLQGENLADGEGLNAKALSLIGIDERVQTDLIDINDKSDTFEPVIAYIEENL